MTAIELCRTGALGGHVEACDQCGHRRIAFKHCPRCQSLARAQWLEDRRAELLETQYFHVVFTLPEPIAAIAYQNKALVYGLLFCATAEPLRIIAADPKHLGAEIGFFAVLHTWGQNLLHHRICIASSQAAAFLPTAIGGSPASPASSCPSGCSREQHLEKAFDAGQLKFFSDLQDLSGRDSFRRYLAPLRKAEWVVYAKPPFVGPEQVLDYVGRYTHRVAISNNRLVAIEDGKVAFRWKDYRQGSRQKVMTVAVDEFIRRFLLHVLPEAEAIRYALGRRAVLERFLADGRIELDSNTVERAIRPQTITRKNSLFAGSDGGGRTWATIATLLATAKMNYVDPHAWLTQTLERIANGWLNSDIDALMPWNYQS